jgi:hypothetical protein
MNGSGARQKERGEDTRAPFVISNFCQLIQRFEIQLDAGDEILFILGLRPNARLSPDDGLTAWHTAEAGSNGFQFISNLSNHSIMQRIKP